VVARRTSTPVEIGDCCHIGGQSVVAKGVTIGSRSVVGACSFVNRDMAPHSIVAGAPARAIGRVDVDDDGVVELQT
jgi:acetyltransferase-like isoleucine patch superfamily enzyme